VSRLPHRREVRKRERHGDRAHGRRCSQDAKAQLPDLEDVARENRQQGRRASEQDRKQV